MHKLSSFSTHSLIVCCKSVKVCIWFIRKLSPSTMSPCNMPFFSLRFCAIYSLRKWYVGAYNMWYNMMVPGADCWNHIGKQFFLTWNSVEILFIHSSHTLTNHTNLRIFTTKIHRDFNIPCCIGNLPKVRDANFYVQKPNVSMRQEFLVFFFFWRPWRYCSFRSPSIKCDLHVCTECL